MLAFLIAHTLPTQHESHIDPQPKCAIITAQDSLPSPYSAVIKPGYAYSHSYTSLSMLLASADVVIYLGIF